VPAGGSDRRIKWAGESSEKVIDPKRRNFRNENEQYLKRDTGIEKKNANEQALKAAPSSCLERCVRAGWWKVEERFPTKRAGAGRPAKPAGANFSFAGLPAWGG